LKKVKETQVQQGNRLQTLEKNSLDAPAGHALARALQLRMNAMGKRIAELEAQNRALKVKGVGLSGNQPTTGQLAKVI
jgi:hypothetical protein